MAKDSIEIPGINFTGDIHIQGDMFNIHDNQNVYFGDGWKPKANNKVKTKRAKVSKEHTPRETMTFNRRADIIDANLTLLYKKMAEDGLIEGNEVDFKALFSGKRDEECELTWTGKYGKSTLVGIFKRFVTEELILTPDGYTLSSVLEGHFKDKNDEWLGGLDKGDEPHKKALPLMVEYVRLLKLKPDKALG